jgi:WD40 repeat protein
MNLPDTTPRSLTAGRLTAALDEVGDLGRPNYLPDIVAQAGRTRQRPAWTFLERWLPMDIAVRRQGVPRAVLIFAVLALLVTVLVTVALLGAGRSGPVLTTTNGLLAFASGSNIDVIQPDGSGRRALLGGSIELGGMAFSSDGGRLAYWSRSSSGGPWALTVVAADGTHPVTIAGGVLDVTTPYPAWSPDGAHIAYSARTAPTNGIPCAGNGSQNGDFCTSRVFVAAADGSGTRQVGDPGLDARSPDWSPNGRTIAFGGGNATPGIGVHLYLMGADGSNVQQLSDVIGSDWAFVRVDWSHDGKKIVGQAGAAGNIAEWDIWIIPLDGSAPTDVGAHSGGDEIIPSWAPDRDALAWFGNGIVLLEQGANPVDLPGAGAPQWSPDGKFLASTTNAGANVIDLKGNVQWSFVGPAGEPAWQPVLD